MCYTSEIVNYVGTKYYNYIQKNHEVKEFSVYLDDLTIYRQSEVNRLTIQQFYDSRLISVIGIIISILVFIYGFYTDAFYRLRSDDPNVAAVLGFLYTIYNLIVFA